ncbi:Gfo/Idh/MocA family protein [Amnibacterium setariae]|uniref:Gfo/Idh/MocA family oxidoreductase n=1 Tax=Amnibacterium setariae TaxID=2306585 RepID=A0A3A1U2W1_9MICO|nr:Gfo/Idh/MocA family oxidoreductase [Amnibacterium setariae]RIX30742.1 gfo/Idh/MocA family oxidoreductase [Amnibacterium setariae]
MPETLNVAVAGYAFMGRIHTAGWAQAAKFFGTPARVTHVIGRNRKNTQAFADAFGIPNVLADWRDAVADPDIHVVDVCTPGDSHVDIAIGALEAGKHVLCEKPLANSVAGAERMVAAAEAASARGVRSMAGFSYRRTPALAYAKRLVDEGRIGEIRHIRAVYLQDWIADPEFPLVWRLDKDAAGSGALGDIGAHIIDLATFLTGQRLTGLTGITETFVKTRPKLAEQTGGLTARGSEERGEVTVDDAAVWVGRTDGGALATFEATRFAAGRKNAMRIELNGSKGSLAFDFERMNELEFLDFTEPAVESGFRRILVTEPEHPYVGAWWPAGHGLGYEHTFTHEVKDFTDAIVEGRAPEPSFADGLAVQKILAAIEDSRGDWVTL